MKTNFNLSKIMQLVLYFMNDLFIPKLVEKFSINVLAHLKISWRNIHDK